LAEIGSVRVNSSMGEHGRGCGRAGALFMAFI
jgi:hypothetical protein